MSKVLSKPVEKTKSTKVRKMSPRPYWRLVAEAKALPLAKKLKLFDALGDDTRKARYAQLVARVKESEAEYARGEYFEGTAEEIIRALKK